MPTISDIMDIPRENISDLSIRELRPLVSQLASAANKRLRRAQQRGLKFGSNTEDSIAGIKRFSTAGKNINELRAEFIRAERYLESKWASLTGQSKLRKTFISEIGISSKLGRYISEMSPKEFMRFSSDAYRLWGEVKEDGYFKPLALDSNQEVAIAATIIMENEEEKGEWGYRLRDILEDMTQEKEAKEQYYESSTYADINPMLK